MLTILPRAVFLGGEGRGLWLQLLPRCPCFAVTHRQKDFFYPVATWQVGVET